MIDIEQLENESWDKFTQSNKDLSHIISSITSLVRKAHSAGYISGHSRGYVDRMAEEQDKNEN